MSISGFEFWVRVHLRVEGLGFRVQGALYGFVFKGLPLLLCSLRVCAPHLLGIFGLLEPPLLRSPGLFGVPFFHPLCFLPPFLLRDLSESGWVGVRVRRGCVREVVRE